MFARLKLYRQKRRLRRAGIPVLVVVRRPLDGGDFFTEQRDSLLNTLDDVLGRLRHLTDANAVNAANADRIREIRRAMFPKGN